jgi:transcription elongation factor Elf1
MIDQNDVMDTVYDEILDNLFRCPLCRNTRLPIVEWGSQSMAYGAIIMHCRTCGAEVHYYVDEEKTEKVIRDRVLSRYSEKNITRLVDEALRNLHPEGGV